MQENITTLYRKYRPLIFDDVVGQDAIIQTLKNQIKNNKLSHAYLFCGTRGTGKTTVAKILARAVNCENRQGENPCNKCKTCESILYLESNVDIIEMDAASNTGIDDVRILKEHIDYHPSMAKYKVFIIDEAHALSTKACEALLKTIEEPPEYVIFILATTDPEQLKSTIRSRCQRFDFKRINVDVIKQRLAYIAKQENIKVEEKALEYIALQGDGSLRDAVSLFDKAQAFAKGEKLTYEKIIDILGTIDISKWGDLLENLQRNDAKNSIIFLKNYLDTGKDILRFVSDFIWYLRCLIFAKNIDNAKEILEATDEMYDIVKGEAKKYSDEVLIFYIEELSDLLNKLKKTEEKRIILETKFIQLCIPESIYSPESVMARLESLENKINSPNYINANSITSQIDNISDLKNDVEKLKTTDKDIENNKALTGDVKSSTPTKNKIVLNKSEYENFKMIQEDWDNFIESLTFLSKGRIVCLRGAQLHFNKKDNSFNIVVDSDFSNRCITDYIDIINEKAKERYNKEIKYNVLLDKEHKNDNNVYVTEDDYKNFNMEVELEEGL